MIKFNGIICVACNKHIEPNNLIIVDKDTYICPFCNCYIDRRNCNLAVSQRIAMRKVVEKFAIAMEEELRENDHKGGWERCTIDFLLEKLEEEINEFTTALKEGNKAQIKSEGADVANIVMMIVDNMGGL